MQHPGSRADAEAAVERHYATLHLTPRQRDDLSEHLASTAENTATDRPDPRGSHNTFELYCRCSNEQRRQLNQLIFRKLYIAGDRITSHELACSSELRPPRK